MNKWHRVVEGLFEQVEQVVEGLFEQVAQVVEGLFEQVAQVVEGLFDGLLKGILKYCSLKIWCQHFKTVSY